MKTSIVPKLFCFLLIWGGHHCLLFGQKAKSYHSVTSDLVKRVIDAPSSKTPVSLAVVPFTATASSAQNSRAFGEYLTETIVGALAGHSDRLKLFERTRLDAIMKEQELILTDLLKPAAALKIGQLAPIDAILSGTYTKLKSRVDISTRIIDVSTGEITASFAGSIKIDKNLKSLFEKPDEYDSKEKSGPTSNPTVQVIITNQVNTGNSSSPTRDEVCLKMVEQFRHQLNDLSSEQRISQVTREAMLTPFDNQCGRLHFDVMFSFKKHQINPSAYHQFLLATLDTLSYPAGDDRALEIIDYFAMDGVLDREEWGASLQAMTRIGNYSLSSYVSHTLAKTQHDLVTRQGRIDAFFALAAGGKLGLPRPVSFETAFLEMMEGLKSQVSLREYVYRSYSSKLQPDDKLDARLFTELASIYKDENESQQKTEIVRWLASFVNTHEYSKAHDQLYDFVAPFVLPAYGSHTDEIRKQFPESDLRLLTQLCRGKFATYATQSKYSSQTEDRVRFCVRHQIPIPGVIPTGEEVLQILKGNILEDQVHAMELLLESPEDLKFLEPALIALLSRRSIEDRNKLEKIQNGAMEILGNLKTSQTSAIEYMLNALPHYGNDTEVAKVALVKIGKPAVSAIVARLERATDQDGGLLYQLIELLGKIGKDAQPGTKAIRRVLNQTRNTDIRYAAEAALQAIEN